jgi:heat shock protein HtpX
MWEAIRANKRKSALLITALASVLLILGYAIGGSFDPQSGGVLGVLIAMAVWVVLVLVSVAGGEKILLATTGAHEVTHETAPQVFNIVEEMKIASGLPAMPRVYIIDSNVPNAFAVGLNPKRAAVAVTTGLLARLDRDELQGVIAHEIGHISNRDTLFMTLAGVTMGAIIILADFYLRGMRFGLGRSRSSSSKGGGQAAAIMFIIALVFAILAPILAQMLYFACSRKREYLADASGAQFTRYPEGLASALSKISSYQGEGLKVNKAVAPMFTVNPLAAAGRGSSVFSTHPPTEDRIRVLRGMGKSSSLAAYEEAFRATHKNRSVLGARNLASSVENGIRERSAPETKPDAAKQWRSAQDLLQKASQYATIACACGLNIKLPPAFDQKTVVCPRCGTSHQVPLAELTAAATVLQTAMNKPMKPVRR